MASFLFSSLLVAGLVAPSISLSVPRDVLAAPGVLKLPITAVPTENKPLYLKGPGWHKRQITDPVINDQNGLEYLINISIGTPPQNVTCVLDTGSSETWVNPTCANAQRPAICRGYSRYTPKNSTTAKTLGGKMSIQYGSGSANGDFYADTMTLGGSKIVAQQFGVATSTSSIDTGLMGIGWGTLRPTNTGGTAYPNIIDQLAAQNVTKSRAFSLDLGSIDSGAGSIIFGGIDTKKYYGALEKVSILKAAESPDKFSRYWINMNSMGVTQPGSKISTSVFKGTQGVFLDSGGTLSQLPSKIVTAIVALFPGAVNVGSGQYTVPCSTFNQTGSVDFGFGNTTITVPYHQFVWLAGNDRQGKPQCALGVMATDDNTYVLGDTFLRSAFVVYDQDNEQMLLANSANCGTNLVAIGKGVDAVPSITGACPKPTTVAAVPSQTKQVVKTTTKAVF